MFGLQNVQFPFSVEIMVLGVEGGKENEMLNWY